MKVNQVVELENGALDFTANLSADELQMVVEVGLNVLLDHGSSPFLNGEAVAAHQIQAGTSTPQ